MGREMAETGRLRTAAAPTPWGDPVTQLRIAIVLATLLFWELLARSTGC